MTVKAYKVDEIVGMTIVNSEGLVKFPLSSLMTEDEQIDLFAMLEALNDNPEDNSSERYFPIFDYILKINGNGLGKAPHSISVSERHWRAYQMRCN